MRGQAALLRRRRALPFALRRRRAAAARGGRARRASLREFLRWRGRAGARQRRVVAGRGAAQLAAPRSAGPGGARGERGHAEKERRSAARAVSRAVRKIMSSRARLALLVLVGYIAVAFLVGNRYPFSVFDMYSRPAENGSR